MGNSTFSTKRQNYPRFINNFPSKKSESKHLNSEKFDFDFVFYTLARINPLTMKKIIAALIFVLVYSFGYGQNNGHHNTTGDDHWNVFGNTADASDVLGTANAFPLNFITNGINKMTLDVNGNLQLTNLKSTNSGNRILLTDPNGFISALPQGGSGQFLQSNGTWGSLPSSATVWSVSGSKLSLSPGTLLGIGTIPAYPLDVVGSAHITNDLIVDGGIVLTDINKTASGLIKYWWKCSHYWKSANRKLGWFIGFDVIS